MRHRKISKMVDVFGIKCEDVLSEASSAVIRIKLSVNLKQSSPYARRIRGMPEPKDSQ